MQWNYAMTRKDRRMEEEAEERHEINLKVRAS